MNENTTNAHTPPTPVVYEEENSSLEHKHLERDLQQGKPLSEKELNKYGNDGWELAAAFVYQSTAHYYLKRSKPG